jgi:[acyl-carrier-protein] S-malonyltransferase
MLRFGRVVAERCYWADHSPFVSAQPAQDRTLVSKIAFLFPGQGAQSVGMGRQLAESLSAARQLFDRAAEVLGYDLAKICFDGPAEELDSTVYSQPALFVTSLAAIELLRRDSPDVLLSCEGAAGLSLGEYTALVFAGVMDFEAGLALVQERGAAMQDAADATPSGMVSILGLERAQVEALCDQARRGDEVLQVANLLCPGNIVVSGSNAACERAAEMASAAGAMKAIPLAVAGAFHTPIMGPAVERLTAALADVTMSRPTIPVVSNVDARPHDDPEEIRQLLIQQVVSPVRWEDSMRYLLSDGYTQFYEVGPGRVLRSLMKRIDRKTICNGVLEA